MNLGIKLLINAFTFLCNWTALIQMFYASLKKKSVSLTMQPESISCWEIRRRVANKRQLVCVALEYSIKTIYKHVKKKAEKSSLNVTTQEAAIVRRCNVIFKCATANLLPYSHHLTTMPFVPAIRQLCFTTPIIKSTNKYAITACLYTKH